MRKNSWMFLTFVLLNPPFWKRLILRLSRLKIFFSRVILEYFWRVLEYSRLISRVQKYLESNLFFIVKCFKYLYNHDAYKKLLYYILNFARRNGITCRIKTCRVKNPSPTCRCLAWLVQSYSKHIYLTLTMLGKMVNHLASHINNTLSKGIHSIVPMIQG